MNLPYIVHTNLHKEMTFLDHIYVDVGNREVWAIYGSGHPQIRLLYWDKKVNLEKEPQSCLIFFEINWISHSKFFIKPPVE